MMLRKLRLQRFKSFCEAELRLGPLTLLLGANASGKSNIRDAFRFLHGVSRGYSLADTMGVKYTGGDIQWRGIRGGPNEIAFGGATSFALGVTFVVAADGGVREGVYEIEVDPGANGRLPAVTRERLEMQPRGVIFDSHPTTDPAPASAPHIINVRVWSQGTGRRPAFPFSSHQPVIHQLAEGDLPKSFHELTRPASFSGRKSEKTGTIDDSVRQAARRALAVFGQMRFLDLSADAMREPSFVGQTVLGDRGENLPSALKALCDDADLKSSLVQWLQALTPMDAVDLAFPLDPQGRVTLSLVEADGKTTSSYSASDGTLRFLALVAALLGPEPSRFYFFEELENGLHPTRLRLLVQLIENAVADGGVQVVATTHSPQLLSLLSDHSLADVAVTHRLPESKDTKIVRLLDIGDARRVLGKHDPASLHASGWLENAIYFQSEPGETE